MNWTPENIKQLPSKDGFYLRGDSVSRIETFVAAAFAFLLTMVMVAGNDIPQSVDEFRLAILNIPAFCICSIQIVWIWHEHASWSRRYGLEDAWTVVLSGLLIVIVMVYVYPLKAMAGGFLNWLSDGLFPTNIMIESLHDIRFLFVFYSTGFMALSLSLLVLHWLALSRANSLCLTAQELHQTRTEIYAWQIMSATAFISLILALILEGTAMSFAGLIYMTLGGSLTLLHVLRAKSAPKVEGSV